MPAPRKDFYVHIGAPDPIIVRLRAGGESGTLVAMDSSLKFQMINAGGTVTLTVGDGITLSTDEAVSDAQAAVQLTVAQSRAIPVGSVTRYELQRVTSGREEVILMGKLIGYGGDNPDA